MRASSTFAGFATDSIFSLYLNFCSAPIEIQSRILLFKIYFLRPIIISKSNHKRHHGGFQ